MRQVPRARMTAPLLRQAQDVSQNRPRSNGPVDTGLKLDSLKPGVYPARVGCILYRRPPVGAGLEGDFIEHR